MYSWYRHANSEESGLCLIWDEQMSLAGCKNGIIATELKEVLHEKDNPPVGWTIPIAEKWNPEGWSAIIDIKPKTNEVFLCELDRVFGYCFHDWTAIMLRLRVLYSEASNKDIDKMKFMFPEETEIIYTMLYLYGSIRDGQLIGTWRAPFGTVTALLVWPEAMTFFYEQIKQFNPEFLTTNVKVISSLRQPKVI